MPSPTFWSAFRLLGGVLLVLSGPYVFVVAGSRLFGVLCVILGLVWIVREGPRLYRTLRSEPGSP
ncbi:hypothetical protein ACFO5R_19810 [Halosolutus amylolyticus]|uniref:Uncharacterized protein n=1 Tax=Halosolutus amylolyticus TaxID=2932267 RepID=A0ABD5PUP4_9EURY|nr:hypothetical protein [Halosolutus amylolyticus]